MPAAAVPDPQKLLLTTRVNGEIMQQANTGDMIHSVAAIISYISLFTHLEPFNLRTNFDNLPRNIVTQNEGKKIWKKKFELSIAEL